MLKIYDYLDEVLATQQIRQTQHRQTLKYYASEIMERMGDTADTDFDEAIFRTMKICTALDIAIADNFKKIYRYNGERMVRDWRLSSLASYLLLLNGNPMNPSVAKAQMFAALNAKK